MEITRTTDDEQTTLWNGLAGHAWVALQVLDQMFVRPRSCSSTRSSPDPGARCSPSATARATGARRRAAARRRGAASAHRHFGSDDHRRPGPRRRESTPTASSRRARASPPSPARFDMIMSRFDVMFFKGMQTDVMHWKQKLAMAIRAQFRQPRGGAGWLTGWEMALDVVEPPATTCGQSACSGWSPPTASSKSASGRGSRSAS